MLKRRVATRWSVAVAIGRDAALRGADVQRGRSQTRRVDMESADKWSRHLTTHSRLAFYVRPARPEDESNLADFFERVTAEDKRFRFLSSIRVGHDQLAAMTNVDHHQTESFVALGEDGIIIATAMLA